MRPVLLYRKHYDSDQEIYGVADRYFDVYNHRTDVPENSLVIARYCCLPFYRDLEYDLAQRGSKLINTFSEYEYVSDLISWYEDLRELTPKTWDSLHLIPETGPFVLKGQTNSKKHDWNKFMYAKDKKEAVDVYLNLASDGLISQQSIYTREFVALNSFGTMLSGAPLAEEYRFFVLNGKVISGGLYWSSHKESFPEYCTIDRVPALFLDRVLTAVGDKCSFYTIDVGIQTNGQPIVIELNEGQMSGLSDIDPDAFYKRLRGYLD